MMHKARFMLAAVTVYVVASSSLMAFALSPGSRSNNEIAKTSGAQTSSQTLIGQSQTLLPDGQVLLLGGIENGIPVKKAALIDSSTGASIPVSGTLLQARAYHTATLLPNGKVLIIGGIGEGGGVLGQSELFDPGTQAFTYFTIRNMEPRSHHTATLRTDGHLLLAGGYDSKKDVLGRIDLLDCQSGAAASLAVELKTPRVDHRASLLSDDSVELWGGQDGSGSLVSFGEIIDSHAPSVYLISRMQGFTQAQNVPRLAESLPQSGETGVSPSQIIALRFSKPLNVTTVNEKSITLRSSTDHVTILVVPAENGMLAFITPQNQLDNSTTYTLHISGATDPNGLAIPDTSVLFTTAVAEESTAVSSGSNDADGKSSDTAQQAEASTPISQWKSLRPLEAPEGVTALAGQVLATDGSPVPSVLVEIDSQRASTDNTGRFLVQNLGSGHHVMIVDGAPAATKTATYGLYRVGVDLKAGQTNSLNYTFWMTPLDTEHVVHISSPTTSEVVVTNPNVPGLELHIPAGTIIRDTTGNIVTEVGITGISTTQPPFPIKKGIIFKDYFTIQPGGATFANAEGAWTKGRNGRGRGATIHYRNYMNAKPGAHFIFWNYDPAQRGWYSYGNGRVSADAKKIVPEDGTQIFSFDAASASTCSANCEPPTYPSDPKNPRDGEPVDLQSGLFVYTKTDLALNDVIPIALTRTYRQGDFISRDFGIGMNMPYDMYLTGDDNLDPEGFTYQNLILADGSRIHFTRTSPCNGYSGYCEEGGTYTATSTPGDFYGATLQLSGGHWMITKKDGTVLLFPSTWQASRWQQFALVGMYDRHGNALVFTRDGSSNLTKISSPNGRWIQFTYDSSNRVTAAQDNAGRNTSYTYNTAGLMATATDANTGVTQYTYDSDGNMLTIQDPRGIVYLQNQYDANGMVSQQTLADGGVYHFSYSLDTNGNVTQADVIDPRGFAREVAFNSDGYMTSDIRAMGKPEQQTVSYSRQQGTGFLLSSTDSLSRTTAYTHDSMGNITSVTRLAGTSNAVTTTLGYDSRYYELASITDPLGNTTQFAYDDSGNLLTATDPVGNSSTYTYNSAGQPTTVTDPLGNQAQFTYDAGDLVGITDPLNRTVTRFVDAVGRVSAITDPLAKTTHINYDALNEVISTVDPVSNQTLFTYDGNGNLLTVTDANQHTMTYTYDNMDRVQTRKDPLGNQASIQYDANGDLSQITDRKGQVSVIQYDGLNRPTLETFNDSSTVANTFDAGNRLTDIVDSASGSITRSYDGLDHLLSETTSQGSVGYTYDADGRRQIMTVSGQAQVSYTFDAVSQLASITQGASNVAFAYDADGRRTSLTLPNGVVATYDYDTASQLTRIVYAGGALAPANLEYGYDQDGRRTSVSGSLASTQLPAAVSAATYNVNNQLMQWGSTAMTYDLNGNTLNDGMNSYTWDARNRLVSANNNGATFSYDAFGRRTGKNILSLNTNFLYDGINPVQEQNGSIITANLLTGGIDEYFTRTDSGGTANFLTDALGSTAGLADQAGNLPVQYSYTPFGTTSITGISNNTFTYTGRESDGLGLYYYRARYYNPATGRFLSEDPLEFRGSGPNLYGYTYDDPIDFRDPSGREIVGGIVGAANGAIFGGLGALSQGGDWVDVLAGAGIGMVGGGLMGAFDPTAGLLSSGAAAAAGDMAGQWVTKYRKGKCPGKLSTYNYWEAGGAFVGGAMGSGITSGLGALGAAAGLGGTSLDIGAGVLSGNAGYITTTLGWKMGDN